MIWRRGAGAEISVVDRIGSELPDAPDAPEEVRERSEVLWLLRGLRGDYLALDALRRLLARHRHGVARLSDDQTLEEVAHLAEAGSLVVLKRPRPVSTGGGASGPPAGADVRSESSRSEEKPGLRMVSARAPEEEAIEELFVLAAEVRAIGGTPLVNHPVRIWDPATKEQVAGRLTTDDRGVVRAVVPRNKTYRIEILDEERELAFQPFDAYEEPAFLVCRFVEEDGTPVANAAVEARSAAGKFDLETDEQGRIDAPAPLGNYELRLEGQVFRAHALLLRDLAEEENHYRFVVSSAAAEEADHPVWRFDTPPHVELEEPGA